MSKVQQLHQAADRRIDSNDNLVAIHSIGTRHHGPFPNSNMAVEVSYSWHRLFHQIGKSRSLGYHRREECEKLHLEEHCLQVWDP